MQGKSAGLAGGMGELTYLINCSLDGYTADAAGEFNFSQELEETTAAYAEEVAAAQTFLYGRRMYETMAVWETDPSLAELSPASARFAAAWAPAEKVVFSTSLQEPLTRRTRIEPVFTREAAEEAKAAGNATIGGPALAAEALRLGVVDVISLLVFPLALGGGTRALPDGLRLQLRLLDERRFANGAVRVSYAVA